MAVEPYTMWRLPDQCPLQYRSPNVSTTEAPETKTTSTGGLLEISSWTALSSPHQEHLAALNSTRRLPALALARLLWLRPWLSTQAPLLAPTELVADDRWLHPPYTVFAMLIASDMTHAWVQFMLVEQIVGSRVTCNTVVVLSYRQTSHVLTNECWPFMVGLSPWIQGDANR